MDDLKISFKVEITGCTVDGKHCPYFVKNTLSMFDFCNKAEPQFKTTAVIQNFDKLTKTCPMVRAQFEALE